MTGNGSLIPIFPYQSVPYCKVWLYNEMVFFYLTHFCLLFGQWSFKKVCFWISWPLLLTENTFTGVSCCYCCFPRPSIFTIPYWPDLWIEKNCLIELLLSFAVCKCVSNYAIISIVVFLVYSTNAFTNVRFVFDRNDRVEVHT